MAEFGSLWKEIDMLSQLVTSASRASATAGHAIPVPPKVPSRGENGHRAVSLFPPGERMPFPMLVCVFVLFPVFVAVYAESAGRRHLTSKVSA